MGCILSCIYSFFCREFNFVVFPRTEPTYNDDLGSLYKDINLCRFKNRNNQNVPYLEMKINDKPECMLYFHGNAEDVGASINFLLPIQQQTGLNIYALQYPTYGVYTDAPSHGISDRIKTDSIDFFKHIQEGKRMNKEDIAIFGRSIGSGPAAYLASNAKNKNLILMSPFTTIPQVAKDFVICFGRIVKEHFNNQASIQKYKGRLLIIHGQIDEVISIRHGKKVHQVYLHSNQNPKPNFIAPKKMSHNYFDMQKDIVKPIGKFLIHDD